MVIVAVFLRKENSFFFDAEVHWLRDMCVYAIVAHDCTVRVGRDLGVNYLINKTSPLLRFPPLNSPSSSSRNV